MKREIILETKTWDLDWNRHVTSRTYEKFGYEGRLACLDELGFPILEIIHNKQSIHPIDTQVRFLAQQFPGSQLIVDTELFQTKDGKIHSHQMILNPERKPVCDLKTSFLLLNESKKPITISKLSLPASSGTNANTDSDKNALSIRVDLKSLPEGVRPLKHDLQIKYSDMNSFWTVTNESIWKYFEEGRFLFFKEIVGFDSVHETDTTTFFMGGDIHIQELPEPGTTIHIVSWIESVEKIRFYFRQDLVDSDGKVLASMKDEQLFIKLSKSRPCKVPEDFLKIIQEKRLMEL